MYNLFSWIFHLSGVNVLTNTLPNKTMKLVQARLCPLRSFINKNLPVAHRGGGTMPCPPHLSLIFYKTTINFAWVPLYVKNAPFIRLDAPPEPAKYSWRPTIHTCVTVRHQVFHNLLTHNSARSNLGWSCHPSQRHLAPTLTNIQQKFSCWTHSQALHCNACLLHRRDAMTVVTAPSGGHERYPKILVLQ